MEKLELVELSLDEIQEVNGGFLPGGQVAAYSALNDMVSSFIDGIVDGFNATQG